MMGTYELVIAFLSTDSPTSPSSTTEVTTVRTRKVLLNQTDAEANAVNESEY